ncbi:MAG TPA: hypothetical protein ENJ77_00705 [Candidatus Moranbacteria bacterium]|nr:hypothetical protein [Candidatus Moranbacteria bacterium]
MSRQTRKKASLYDRVVRYGRRNEAKIVVFLATAAAVFAGFALGFFYAVEERAPSVSIERGQIKEVAAATAPSEAKKPASDGEKRVCRFVGSRKSDKYYPPECSHARRIAPENLRCFLSAADAESKGYTRSKACR